MSGRPLRKRIKNDAIYYTVRVLLQIVTLLPERVACGALVLLGRLVFRVARRERERVLRHLRSAFPEKTPEQIRALARQVFIDLGKNGCAAIRIPHYVRNGLDRYVRIEGREHLDRALARGKGVLAITGHIGCWELMAAWFAHNGYQLAVVGRELYDPRFDAMLVSLRQGAGMVNFNRDGAARKMLRWLRNGGMLGVLIDQDTGVESEFVKFFGRLAKTPSAPVVLAQRLGAAVVPMAIHRQQDGRHVITVMPELDLIPDDGKRETRIANVQKCSDAIEAFIRMHPAQWVWMHERWKSQPETRESGKA